MSTQKGRETGTSTNGINFVYKEGEGDNAPYDRDWETCHK